MLLNQLIKFETERLLIRVVETRDLPDLLEINSTDEVTRYVPYKTWGSTADSEAWFERMATLQSSGTAVQLVLALRDSGRVIGACLIFAFDEVSLRAEIGYVLGVRDSGRGYMAEAVSAVVAFAFEELGMRRLEATIDPRNGASVKLIERMGFNHEGTRRQRVLMKGTLVDQSLYGCLRDDWIAVRRGSEQGTGRDIADAYGTTCRPDCV